MTDCSSRKSKEDKEMKKLLLTASLAIAVGQLAFADIPELFIRTGANIVTVTGAGNTVTYSNANFGVWQLNLVFGVSNSPGLVPYGLDITNLTAECLSGTCADLNVWLSDISFTQQATGFKTFYSATDTGTSASTSQTAWVGLDNLYFSQTNLIGTVGPILGAGGSGTASAGIVAGPAPYSLTIEDTFTGCTGTNCAGYSTDGNITSVPDGGTTMMLLGGVLVGLETLRRRFRS
jgi:hypothetical protein